MPYCMYLRKSRADVELEALGEMETLARHEKMLLDVARKLEISVSQIYREIVSGESIASRPMVQKLLDEVEDGRWEGVLVTEIERLARGDTIDQGVVARAFKSHNTKIITPSKTFDPANEFDEEYFEFGLFMSRREYKTINKRQQRGRTQSVKDGKYIASTPPYGYDRVRLPDKGYTLVPNAEAETVQMIFDLFLSGDGCTTIANKLDSMGVPSRRGGVWSKATVRDILRNPTYIGKVRWGYRSVIQGTDRDSRKINRDCLLIDGLHDPIVDLDTFNRAQNLLKSNRRVPVRADLTLKNPLSGLGYCAVCGSRMTRLGPNAHCPYDTLKCSNRYCSNVSAPLSLVEKDVVEQLRKDLREYIVGLAKKTSEVQNTVQDKALKKLSTEIAKIDKQLSSAYDLLEQGIYSTDVFLDRQRTLSEKKAAIQEDMQILEQQKMDAAAVEEGRRVLPEALNILDGYGSLTRAEDKNAILRQVMSRFTYLKTERNSRTQRDRCNFIVHVYPKLP